MATLLKYSDLVEVDMSADNDVNFADVEDYGHRVVVEMKTSRMNDYLGWVRQLNEDRPTAKLNSSNEAAFKTALEAALGAGYTDIDGVTNGLHFGSENMSTNTDPRLRKNGSISSNDIPMAFVLYKLYGSSSTPTLGNIYNLGDAYDMLSNSTLATAIVDSFKAGEAGAVDMMFRDLLAAVPSRFFDASGIPMTGMFETNTDVYGSGDWKLIENDIIEIKVKFVFKSKVSRRGVAGREHDITNGTNENQQTIISPEDYFYIRLQLKAKNSADDGSGGGGGGGAFTPASITGLVGWYDGADASTVTQSGGTVTVWADKSGLSRNATAAAGSGPTYVSNGIYFGNQLMTYNQPWDTTHSVIMVASKSTETAYYFARSAGPGSSPAVIINFDGTKLEFYNADDRATLTSSPSDVFIAGFTYDLGAQNTLWYNGNKVSTISQTVPNNYPNNEYDRFGNINGTLNASLFEFIFYDSPLSDVDMTAVMNYLKTKWSIP